MNLNHRIPNKAEERNGGPPLSFDWRNAIPGVTFVVEAGFMSAVPDLRRLRYDESTVPART